MTENDGTVPGRPRDAGTGSRSAVAGLARLTINLLILAGLTALVLSPLLKTGYVSDDITNSLVPGKFKLEQVSLLRAIAILDWDWMKQGRFFPLQMAEIWTMFTLVPNLTAYKVV